MSENDVVIVGGGAAGLSAALVLSRALRRVLVVDAGRPRNAPAAHMHGFLSRDGLPPSELLSLGRDEVQRYGGSVLTGTVTGVARAGAGFEVALDDGRRTTARRLLVTTGLRDDLPSVPGLRERFGRDVLHCPYCHGHEVRGRRLAVLGAPGGSLHQVHLVRQWSDDVVLLPHTAALTEEQHEQLDARGVVVVAGEVTRVVVEDDVLRGVEVAGGLVECDAVFVAPMFVPASDLLASLGCEVDENGFAVVDRTGRTTVDGVWAAGNATNPRAQVVTAAGEGSAAAIALNADLVEQDVRDAVARARLGRPA